jgi:predicted permease
MRTLFSKVLAMFRRRFLDQDFDAEVEAHVQMLIEQNVGRGMTPDEARQAALRSMGNVTRVKESQRESRGLPQIETLFADLKYGARTLRANPGFTLIAALTLSLGIGVVTTVFTAYNAVALKPLPVADPSQVVRLERWFANSRGDFQYEFSYPEYLYCRDRNDVFTGLVAASGSHAVVADDSDKLAGQLVTANYFTDLGVPAQVGRTFLPDEDRTPGGNPVIVLSNAFWERRFHGDREITGRILKLNGVAFTVVGVAAREFNGTAVIPQVPDFWAPVSMQAQLAPGRDWLNMPGDKQFQILARIKPGVGPHRAEAETATLIQQFAGTYKEADRTITVTLQRTSLVGNTEDVRFQASVLAIMLIVGMVLLVGCVNIANMLLARGAARQKEISVRLALGASRGRIIRQLLTESLLLSLIGGAGGLLFSIWTGKLLWIGLQQFLQKTSKGLGFDIAVGIDLSPDWRVLAYAMALSLFAGLLFGLSPALQFSRPDLTVALKTDGGFGGGWSRSRLRSLLVATQVTVSMVLLISAGLLMRGLSRAEVATPGYETQSVYSVSGDFGADPVKVAALEQRLMDRFQNLPEVRNVALGTMPLLGTWTLMMVVGNERGRTLNSYASDTYFDLFGIPIVRGRHLTRLESEQGVNHLAIVSESAARKFWPGEDPIGRHFKLDMNYRGSYMDFEIIGVAKDVRFTSLSRVDVSHVYLAPKPGAWNAGLLVRTEGDSRRAVAALRAAAGTIDPRLAAGLSTMNLEAGPVQLSRSFAQISALFAAILAALALALAGVGIYGVMSYLVSRSVKEIGVRVALGAKAGDVLLSVIVRGLRPVFCGLVLGVAGAAALSALLHATLALPGSSDFFYGVPFYDPATFLGLSAFLIIVAAIASAIPARRALGVDPMVALRYE